MAKVRVLFICLHNSARSQMAEAFVNRDHGDRFAARSAGFDPRPINPLVVEVMAEEGLDLAGKASTSVHDLADAGVEFDHVVTVCDETHGQSCPIAPVSGQVLVATFPDPADFAGDRAQRLGRVRELRDDIQIFVNLWTAQTLADGRRA